MAKEVFGGFFLNEELKAAEENYKIVLKQIRPEEVTNRAYENIKKIKEQRAQRLELFWAGMIVLLGGGAIVIIQSIR
jgi:hypothetical protein